MPRKPAFIPTDTQRQQVSYMAMGGADDETIAGTVIDPTTDRPISVSTLRYVFKHELSSIGAVRDAAVLQRLYQDATTPAERKAHHTTAAIFWAKARLGWRDQDKVEDKTSDEQRRTQIANADRAVNKLLAALAEKVSKNPPVPLLEGPDGEFAPAESDAA